MADRGLIERREFPSRYNALPGISSHQKSHNNQIERQTSPKAVSSQTPSQGFHSKTENAESRFRQMEARVLTAEHLNQGLLEQVSHTRNQLQAQIQRTEEALRSEQAARQTLENSLKMSRDLIVQLAAHVQRVEERRQEDRGTVSGIADQMKSIEQQSLLAQKDAFTRQEHQAAQMEEMMIRLNDMIRGKEGLERTLFETAAEVKRMRAKVDAQSMDLVMTAKQLKDKSEKLEEENWNTVENIRRTNETQSYAEQAASQLRSLIEQRLIEVRDAILDIRNRLDDQQKDQRSLDQRFSSRLSELQVCIGEQSRKHDEAVGALELAQRSRDHATETEMTRLHSLLMAASEDLISKMSQTEAKIREESQVQYAQILTNESENREQLSRILKDEIEAQLEEFRESQRDTSEQAKEVQANEKRKVGEVLHKLNDAINLVEKEFEEYKKHQARQCAAEIQSRKLMEGNFMSKVTEAEDKTLSAVKQLRDSLQASQQSQANGELFEEMRQRQDLLLAAFTEMQKTVKAEDEIHVQQQLQDSRIGFSEELRARNQELKNLCEQMAMNTNETENDQMTEELRRRRRRRRRRRSTSD